MNNNRTTFLITLVGFVVVLVLLFYLEARRPNPDELNATVDARVAAALTAEGFQSQIEAVFTQEGFSSQIESAIEAQNFGATAEAQRPIVLTDVALAYPSETPTPTATPTDTPTATATNTPTPTFTYTPTPTATNTPTNTPTATNTATATFTPSNTPTPTFTSTASVTPAESNSSSRDWGRQIVDSGMINLALSPSGNSVATYLLNGDIVIFDLSRFATGREVVGRLSNFISALAWSPDGQYLAAADLSNNLVVWNLRTGEDVSIRVGATVFELEWLADSTRLFALANGEIHVWDTASWERVTRFQPDGFGRVLTFDVAPDGQSMLAAQLRTIEEFAIRNGEIGGRVGRGINIQNPPEDIAYSPDGNFIAVGYNNGRIEVFNSRDKRSAFASSRSRERVYNVAWSPDSRWLLSTNDDGFVRVWNTETGELFYELDHNDRVYRADWRNNSEIVSNTTGLWLWTLPTVQPIPTATSIPTEAVQVPDLNIELLNKINASVSVFSLAPDGTRIAHISSDENVVITDFVSGDVTVLGSPGGDTNSIAWSPDGQYVVVATFNRNLRVWDVNTGEQIADVPTPLAVFDIEWSHNSRYLGATTSRELILWQPTGFIPILESRSYITEFGRDVSWLPDGRIATITPDGIRIYSLRGNRIDGEQAFSLMVGAERVAWSPTGDMAATSAGAEVRIHSTNDGSILHTLAGEGSNILSLAWSPDGGYLAAGSADGIVRVWDIIEDTVVWIHDHPAELNSVAWSSDGQYIVTGSDAIYVWELPLNSGRD